MRRWWQIFVLCVFWMLLLWLVTPCLDLKTDSASQEKWMDVAPRHCSCPWFKFRQCGCPSGLSNSESLLEKEEGRCITYGNCSSCNKQALKFQGLNTFKAKSYLAWQDNTDVPGCRQLSSMGRFRDSYFFPILWSCHLGCLLPSSR